MERIRGLDGLRALAIVMVMGYHASRPAVPAGFWGVILFFVLSGYLITNLLCAEVDRRGRIRIGSFYWKRALRLLPALIIVSILALLLGATWGNVIPALGYYANYARIAGVDLGMMTHTWSLVVEEHFYLLWPLVIAATPARSRVKVIGLIFAASMVWRAIAVGVTSPAWVYNATDTNAAALLAGCFLAVTKLPKWRVSALATPALIGLMFLPIFGHEGPLFLWGSMVATALGVFAVQHATTGPVYLEWKPVAWVGKISYGLYLWHYVLFRSGMSLPLAVVLTVVGAAASWYLVEEPIRRWRVRGEKRRREAEEAGVRSGIDPETPVQSLSPGV